MKKELDSFPAWGTDTALYVVQEGPELFVQYGGIGSGFAKLYGEDIIRALTEIKVDKNQFWFGTKEEVIEYLEEIQEENHEHSNPSN